MRPPGQPQPTYDALVQDRAADLAALPRVDALVAAAGDLIRRYGRGAVVDALRTAVAAAREHVADGDAPPSVESLVADAAVALAVTRPGPPRQVINAAGVVVHTNLGRAPLSAGAIDAMLQAAGYCDVEYDVDSGRRGTRGNRLQPLLATLTGAEAAIAVNNGAAALVLALAALAGGRQVVVSRGELVEIGGSFRLPEVMASAGVRLLEVGTTNRTRAADYEAGDDVGMLLKVHPSNFRVEGFVAAPAVGELADVARRRQIPLLHDIGSGLLRPHATPPALAHEPDVTTSLRDGADLVVCSGDKLLGGPQAGLLLGRADLVARCATSPLARALRLDKVRLAALVATLEAHARDALDELPVWSSVHADPAALRTRAHALARAVDAEVVDDVTMIGGGSTPGDGIATPVVRVVSPGPQRVAAALRSGEPPIIVRVADDAVLVDLRTVPQEDDALVRDRLVAALR